MTLEIGIAEQLRACLALFLFGVADGVLYSLFGLVYCLFGIKVGDGRKRTAILTFLPDLLFCFISALGFSVLDYAFYSGRVRWYLVLAAALGFLLYLVTAGRTVARLNLRLAGIMIKTVKLVFGATIMLLRAAAFPFVRLYTVTAGRLFAAIKGKITRNKCIRYLKKVEGSMADTVRFG